MRSEQLYTVEIKFKGKPFKVYIPQEILPQTEAGDCSEFKAYMDAQMDNIEKHGKVLTSWESPLSGMKIDIHIPS